MTKLSTAYQTPGDSCKYFIFDVLRTLMVLRIAQQDPN